MYDSKTKTTDFGSLVVTHECNKHCPFCIDKYRGNYEYITLTNVIKALEKAKELKLKDILIIGGEPTLHPNIVEIAHLIKSYGFRSIMTTNYTKPYIVKSLDGIVDCFNISFYNQPELPNQKDFESDITITALIHKKHLNTRMELDAFITKYKKHGHVKLSTLSICNDWTNLNQKVNYLDALNGEKFTIFGELEGLNYRGIIIKRNDKQIGINSYQSYKFHVDGEISQSWERNNFN